MPSYFRPVVFVALLRYKILQQLCRGRSYINRDPLTTGIIARQKASPTTVLVRRNEDIMTHIAEESIFSSMSWRA